MIRKPENRLISSIHPQNIQMIWLCRRNCYISVKFVWSVGTHWTVWNTKENTGNSDLYITNTLDSLIYLNLLKLMEICNPFSKRWLLTIAYNLIRMDSFVYIYRHRSYIINVFICYACSPRQSYTIVLIIPLNNRYMCIYSWLGKCV